MGSRLGKYKMASRQAELAIELLKNDLNLQRNTSAASTSSRSLGLIKEDSHDNEDNNENTQCNHIYDNASTQMVSALVVAYYNAGAVQEHLNQYNLSYHYYQLGLRLASQHLSEGNALVTTLEVATTTISKRIVKINIV